MPIEAGKNGGIEAGGRERIVMEGAGWGEGSGAAECER